ncbi:MAG TPA: dihydrofolate reductase [Opitutaceae bacterium]
MPALLHLIVACSENRVIGRDGKLPWRIPEDWEHFQRETAGQVCILGRICYVTWKAARADGRRPIVITRDRSLAQPGVEVVASLPEAIALADTLANDVYICGGQRIYEETFALAAAQRRPLRLDLTLVHAQVDGDTYFPEWRHLPWRELARRESRDASFRYTFLTLETP